MDARITTVFCIHLCSTHQEMSYTALFILGIDSEILEI